MAFQEKVIGLGNGDTLLFECPATLAGSVHGLVFSNVTNAAQALTLRHYTKATGVTVTISQDRPLAANSEFPWPKPINVAAGDRILASTPTANAIVALTAVYLAPTMVIFKGFTPKGTYSDALSYELNDLTEDLGTSYVAIAPSVGSRPPSSAWMVLASRGAPGASVAVRQNGDLRTAAATSLDFTGNVIVSGVGGNQTINIPLVDKTSLGLANVNNTADLDKPVSTATLAALAGKAPLVGGVVPAVYLPSFVDDVLEFPNFAAFPTTGETGKIYLDIGTANTPQYRWTGSTYSLITSSPGSTDAVSEGVSNKYFTENRVLGTSLTGINTSTNSTILPSDTVLAAMGKSQAQISALKAKTVSYGSTVTLNVPAQYASINAALDVIKDWSILGTVIIQVADGTYNLTSSIYLNHPDGVRIKLLGNTTTPANCILRGPSPPTFDALICSNGHTFGLIDGFTIDLVTKATPANNTSAILAELGGTIITGPKIEINNWYYGIAARNGSTIRCRYAKVNNAGDVGIWSVYGSSVDAQYATSTNASDIANGWGFGFQAEHGASLNCSNATATGCNAAGVAALSGSYVLANGATSSNNVGSGFIAQYGGSIENHNAVASGNTQYGEKLIGLATIFGNGKTISNRGIVDGFQESSAKDTSGGYAGLTQLKINFKNVAGTFTSFLTNTNTVARTYTFPDKDLDLGQLGFLAIPVAVVSANYTITKVNSGGAVRHPASDTTARTFTIDSNANQNWADGTAITILNKHGAGIITIAVTTDVMRLTNNGTTGSRTLAANGVATCVWDSAALDWQISGVGLT